MKVSIRTVIAIVVLAVGIVPAAALAHPGRGSGRSQGARERTKSTSATSTRSARSQAEKQCRQERATLGKDTFDKTYGTNRNGRNAFGKCVSRRTRQDEASNERAEKSAVQTCRSERSADPAAFRAKYGTNENGRNAFGKCVSEHARSSSEQTESSEVNGEENAAEQCRSEQSSDPTAFRAKYGTNENGRNAFGKCVSQKARQQEQQGGSGSDEGSGSGGS
jgi:hypothetical protein